MAEERLGASFSIDVTDLKTGLAQANRLIRESQSEFKAAAAGLDDWSKSEDGLNARIKSLSSIIEVQKTKVGALKTEYQRLIDNGLDPASREAVEFRTKINNEEAALASNEAELKDQKKALRELADGSEDAGSKIEKFGNIAKKAAAIAATAFAAAATAVGALVKSAVESYADYEQLVGGVDTLFEKSSKKVQGYADNAYKTAGMSANEYMETVTSFSASLLQSLGGDTEKAAEIADMAITDMSDNANKMGTSMESIQNAYNGFAKQNYTMLDNLKLGYGGTKEEMQRLLVDAEKISGIKYDLSSYADVTTAIHVMQESIGIAGTTAKEASSTISGSLASMKSAWSNLLTGLANEDADLGALTDQLVESIGIALDNIIPRVKEVLPKIIDLVKGIIPEITPLIAEILPDLIATAGDIVANLVMELPNILSEIGKSIPEILSSVFGDSSEIVNGITEGFGWIEEHATGVKTAILGIVTALAAYKTALAVSALISKVKNATEGMTIAQAALNAVMSMNPIGLVVAAIAGLVAAFVYLWKNCDEFREFWINLWEGIKNAAVQVWTTITDFFVSAWEGAKSVLSTIGTWIYDNIIAPVVTFFTEMWNGIVSAYHTVIDPWIEIFKRLSVIVNEEIVQPVLQFFGNLWNGFVNGATSAWNIVVGIFSVVSEWFNVHIVQPIATAFDKIWTGMKTGASKAWEGVKSVFGTVSTFFGDVFSKAWKKVKDVFSVGGKIFDGIKDGIVSAFKVVVNAIIRGINKVVAVPFNGLNSILDKLQNIEILGIKPFDWISWRASVPEIPQLAKGGVVRGATHAIVGEDGAEAVLPLEKNTEWMDKLADKIAGKQKSVVVNQTNNYSQAHSRLELYKSRKQTEAAVRLALTT